MEVTGIKRRSSRKGPPSRKGIGRRTLGGRVTKRRGNHRESQGGRRGRRDGSQGGAEGEVEEGGVGVEGDVGRGKIEMGLAGRLASFLGVIVNRQ